VGWRGAGDDCGIGLTDGGGVGVVILYGVNSFATVLANCECPCSIFRLPYAASSFGIPHAPIPTTKPSLNSNHAVQLPTLPAIPHSTFISPSNPTARYPDSSKKKHLLTPYSRGIQKRPSKPRSQDTEACG